MPKLTRRKLNTLAVTALALPFLPHPARSAPVADLPLLHGINFAGLTNESWSQPPPAEAVDYYIRQKKMNVVRLNFPWEFVQPELNGPLDELGSLALQLQIDRITSAGAYVILEFHNYNRRVVDGVERIIGEHPSLTSQHFADAWTKMAMRWKDNGKVIFELMNEPHDCDTATLVRVSNDAIAAIRATGAQNLIMVCGNDWNSMGWREGSANRTHMLDIVDPLDHFCFDVHHYFDDWSQGKTHNVRNHPIASMEEFTGWAKAHGKKGFCGEFGCSVNKLGMEACRQLLSHMEENPDVYIGWAWWGGGGPWQPDYEFLLDPFASHTSPTNPDPDGSKTWANPVDRPQMKVLQEFLPKEATPFNAWLIEDQLRDRIEAAYRHGDFRVDQDRQYDRWLTYWYGLHISFRIWLSLGIQLPQTSPEQNYAWVDSGPKGHTAQAFTSGIPIEKPVSADLQGGVVFRKYGAFLASEASLAGMRVYAMIAADAPELPGVSTIVAIDDGQGGGNYKLSVSSEDISQASSKAGPERSRVTNGKLPKLLVEAHPLAPASRTETAWSLRLDDRDIRELTVDAGRNGPLVIGAADFAGNDGFHSTLYDLVILTGDIPDSDHARIQGRLHWDLGIAHRLPDTHQYRIRPPSLG